MINKIARWVVGLLFIISGVIKLNDPVGTGIKFEEYFHVFASDFAGFFIWLVPFALIFSVILSTLEVMIGFAVIINYRQQITSWILLLMVLFFTFLTFYSAYTGKVTDCGCFGNAIPMTPWQSFGKNLVLLVLIILLVLNRHKTEPVLAMRTGDYAIMGVGALCLLLAIITIRHLPFADFRAYHVGADIPKKMEPSEQLEYQYTFKRGDETKTFRQYPDDTTWEFQEMSLLNPEAQAKISDFNVWNEDEDYTEKVLTGNKLLIIMYDVGEVNKHAIRMIKPLLGQLQETNNIESLVLTASGEEKYQRFRHEFQLAIPYYFADATVLKTIIRANPGIVLLDDGVVKGKWHYNDVPDFGQVQKLLQN